MRIGVALVCGNLSDKDVAHTDVLKMRKKQVISHDRDARESEGRPILQEGEMMTFIYQPVFSRRVGKGC